MTTASIPLADAPALRPAARRTRAVRTVLAGVLVGLTAAAAFLGRSAHLATAGFFPPGSNGIVVLDLSASISSDTFQRIDATLTQLARTNGRYGLVVFSGTAYEALPPGTPGAELLAFARFFRPQPAPAGFAPTFPPNPWALAFSAGTSISSGLDLARSIVLRERLRRAAVLLVSDLDDDPKDIPRATAAALALRQLGVRLHVVGLNPSPEDERLFLRLAGPRGSFVQAPLPAQVERVREHAPFPSGIVAAAAVVALLLAAHELWAVRLRFRLREAPT